MSLLRACLLVLLAFVVSPLSAQESPRQNQRPRLQELQDRLKLSPDQVEKIRPILAEEADKLRDIRAKYADDTSRRGRQQMGRALQSVRKDANRRIDPILTQEQRDEWKKIREERREVAREQRRKR